ncbi:MAG: hypothetical protein Q7J05_00790 [Paludibacter sp.]|nr:hypothetical protein [Paludibacter sp.]
MKPLILAIIFIGLSACNFQTGFKSVDSKQTIKLSTQQLFPENSIGIAYLDTVIADNYSITIRFPNFTLPDSLLPRDTSNYYKGISIDLPPQTIILFDEKGEIKTLDSVTNCISEFWCENDGGIQYEPTFKLAINKKDFKRIPKLQDKKRLEKISCFAIINYNPTHFKCFYPTEGKEGKNVAMRGRLSNDYSGYAKTIHDSVYKYYDRNAQIIVNDDDSGMTDYCIILQVFNSRLEFELGCCGP